MSRFRAELLSRTQALAELAEQRSEEQLLAAAVWLELRAAVSACAGVLERIAIHYLLLAQHPDVRAQPGLAERYAQRAWSGADYAEHGAPSLAALLERSRADAKPHGVLASSRTPTPKGRSCPPPSRDCS